MKSIPTGGPSFRKLNPHLAVINTGLASKLGEGEPEIKAPLPQNYLFDPKEVQTTDEQKLNKTERVFLARLRLLLPKGAYIGIQNITLKLADDCRLTMDFNYIDENGRFVFVDTKGGFWREDAKLKVKLAARLFRWADFVVAHKDGMNWTEERIKP